MMSRAFAGTLGGKAVFCLPGSTSACVLATREIIIKECEHLIREMGK
jgi:molybdenum cofactor biosynthesis protein B